MPRGTRGPCDEGALSRHAVAARDRYHHIVAPRRVISWGRRKDINTNCLENMKVCKNLRDILIFQFFELFGKLMVMSCFRPQHKPAGENTETLVAFVVWRMGHGRFVDQRVS